MSLSNDEPDRAAMGPHAQECHPQQMLCRMWTIRGRHARFLARQGRQEPGKLWCFGRRQLPGHQPKGFSHSDVNRVYLCSGKLQPRVSLVLPGGSNCCRAKRRVRRQSFELFRAHVKRLRAPPARRDHDHSERVTSTSSVGVKTVRHSPRWRKIAALSSFCLAAAPCTRRSRCCFPSPENSAPWDWISGSRGHRACIFPRSTRVRPLPTCACSVSSPTTISRRSIDKRFASP